MVGYDKIFAGEGGGGSLTGGQQCFKKKRA